MIVLLYKDIILEYFRIVNKVVKTESEKQIVKILENENIKIIINKKIVKYLESEYGKDSDYFKLFIKHIIDNRSVNIASLSTSTSFEEEFLYLNSILNNNLVLKLALYDSHQSINVIQDLAISARQKIPNYDWLIFTLASGETATVRYYHFISNAEIEAFIKAVFNLPKTIGSVTIFDKQCNFGHNLFNPICKCSIKIYYYTYYSNKVDANERYREANLKFGGHLKMFYTRSSNLIHERKILFENFIIEIDDDFWNLTFDRPTWKIDITYSPSIDIQLKHKCSSFKGIHLL